MNLCNVEFLGNVLKSSKNCGVKLSALKSFFDFFQRKCYHRRTALGTEGALTAVFQIFKQFFHRFFIELIVRFHGCAAGGAGKKFRADGIQTAAFI